MSTLVIEEGGFLKIDGGASVMIDGVELNPKTIKKEPKIELTVEEANLLFKVIDGFFDLRLPTTKEICSVSKLKVRVERIAKMEKCNE